VGDTLGMACWLSIAGAQMPACVVVCVIGYLCHALAEGGGLITSTQLTQLAKVGLKYASPPPPGVQVVSLLLDQGMAKMRGMGVEVLVPAAKVVPPASGDGPAALEALSNLEEARWGATGHGDRRG
jgi:hypothetical protein